MPAITLSKTEARKISLYFQGLTDYRFGAGVDGAKAVLEHLGYVQIDTISVVERAHHHVFWSRLAGYRPEFLHALVARGEAFEYWSHAASYLPMRDFRFSLPRKKLYASGKYHWFTPTPEHKRWRRNILARIKAEGPLPARAFEGPEGKKGGGWWDWKPAKQSLEQLFQEGKLMAAGRQGFQKLYDLSERVVPSHVDTTMPSPKEHARHLIESFLRAHGFGRPEEMAYLRKGEIKRLVAAECAHGEKEGFLIRVKVEGMDKTYYALANFPGMAEAALGASIAGSRILSPFDNQVIQRKRLNEVFGYDYFIECYVPGPKRKFGYFCLPILAGGSFVGRLDAKAHRGEKRLEIRSLHWEKKDSWKKVRAEVESFARFNGCSAVSLS